MVYRNYLLTLLMVILAFNQVDQIALGILLQDIKHDLQLTDTQLGILTGIAFAIFYALMGVPIAQWADRGNRVTIISLTAALWSAGVASCGMATNFVQLLLIRIGVAVGEAGAVPPAHSLIADCFDRFERPRAVARYMLGVPLALLIGYFAAGWLNEFYGWRATFIIIGVPGLILGVIAQWTLIEPRRAVLAARKRSHELQAQSGVSVTQPPFRKVIKVLWANRSFRQLAICFSVWSFFGYGLQQWQPAFFIRSHGIGTGELGTWLAVLFGVGGILGVYLGGELATRYAAGNERLQLKACAVAFAFYSLLYMCAFVVPNQYLAFAALGLANLGGNMAQGPILATIQTLVAERMRAMSIAILYLFAHLIGMGFGPLAAGMLSDGLQSWLGNESLRYSLIILCPGYLWAAFHLWCAGRTVQQDLAATGSDDFQGSSKMDSGLERMVVANK